MLRVFTPVVGGLLFLSALPAMGVLAQPVLPGSVHAGPPPPTFLGIEGDTLRDEDFGRFGGWFVGDLAGIVTEAEPRDAAVVLAVGGGAALLSLADEPLSEGAQRYYRGPIADVLGIANELGNVRGLAAVGLLWAGSLLTSNTRLQDAAYTSFESALISGALTAGVKEVVGRARPDTTSDPYTFDPFSGNTSFPSGHTANVFAVVTPWAVYYPSAWTKGLFVLAASTAVSRVAKERHWPSDVLAGAAVGTLTGYLLARRHIRLSAEEGAEEDLLLAPPVISVSFRF